MKKSESKIPGKEKVSANDHLFEKFEKNISIHNIDIDCLLQPFEVIVWVDFLPSPLGTYDLRGELLSVKRKARGTDLMNLEESVVDLMQIKPEHSFTGNIEFIQLFCHEMLNVVRPWVEKQWHVRLNSKKMSIRTSMYRDKDHLLCHNDKVEDRKVAFVLYLSKHWTEECGGHLDLFSKDEKGRPKVVEKSIAPLFNRCVFFKVTDYSYHQVREVIGDFERFSVNGWFHAEDEEEVNENGSVVKREPRRLDLLKPVAEEFNLGQWIRKSRLDNMDFIGMVNKTLEKFSFCGIKSFLKPKSHIKLSQEIAFECVKWTRVGPPDERNYEIADISTLPESLRAFVESFRSITFFRQLAVYSDLDLIPNPGSIPKMSFELQRWSKGCYTLFYDDESTENVKNSESETGNSNDSDDSSDDENYTKKQMAEDIIGFDYSKISGESAKPSSSKNFGKDLITNDNGRCFENPAMKRKGEITESEGINNLKKMKVEEQDTNDDNHTPGVLDVVFYFHADNAPEGMTLNYVNPQEEDGVHLTVPAQNNALFMVFREDGVVRHHEYIDHSCKDYFYSLVCSYREADLL